MTPLLDPHDDWGRDPVFRRSQAVNIGVVAVAGLLGPFVAMVLSIVLPLEPRQVELVQAGGAIIGILTGLAVWVTFGRHAQKLDAADAHKVRRPRRPELDPSQAPVVLAREVARLDTVRAGLGRISRHDPAFSEVDLQVWLRHLAPVVAAAPADAARHVLRPFVALPAWQALHDLLGEAEQVELGPIRITEAEHGHWDRLRLEVGLTARGGGGRDGTWQPHRQVWELRRSSSARSLPLADMMALGCPACGSPVRLEPPEWACAACDRRIGDGQLHWQLISVTPRGGLRDPAWSPDEGGERPSCNVAAPENPELPAELRALRGRCEGFELAALEARVRQAVVGREGLTPEKDWQERLNRALDLEVVDAMREVEEVELVTAGRDGFYERVDVRVRLRHVFARLDAEGTVVDGNPDTPREEVLYLRLAHPSAQQPCTAEGWLPWQVLSPSEYLA